MQLQRTFFYNNLGFTQIHAVKFVKKIQCTGSLAFQLHELENNTRKFHNKITRTQL